MPCLSYNASREASKPGTETRAVWDYHRILERGDWKQTMPFLALCKWKQYCWLQYFTTRSISSHSTIGHQSPGQEGVIHWETLSLASSEPPHAKHWAVFYKHDLMWGRIAITFRLMWTLRLVKVRELASKGTATKSSRPRIQSYVHQSSEHVRLS